MSFSSFAIIGDLSKHTFEELKQQIKFFELEVKVVNHVMQAKWFNDESIFVILYTLSGRFIQIKSETWIKPFYTHFETEFKNKSEIIVALNEVKSNHDQALIAF